MSRFSFAFFVIWNFFVSAVFIACSNDKNEVAGGTEAESTIALQVQLANGMPASLSRVRALPAGYLADGLTSKSWTETDENGFVKLALELGDYAVEIRGSKTNADEEISQGAVVSKTVTAGISNEVDSVSLNALTSIEGFVAPGQGPSVVRIPGLERFVVPDSAGHFVIDSLPLGNFQILIESRSNRGTVKLNAAAGDTVPEVRLGTPRGFAVEDFESFSGVSATGKILGDGWWYTMDAEGKNLLPLWDETLIRAYAGNEGCASGGCAKIYGPSANTKDSQKHLGFLLGEFKTNYQLDGLKDLMFSARGTGVLHVTLGVYDSSSLEVDLPKDIKFDIELSKVWQGFSKNIAIENADSNKNVRVNRIDFSVGAGDTAYLDDVFLGGVTEEALNQIATNSKKDSSDFPSDWNDHSALLKEVFGYALGIRGGEGYIDSLAGDSIQGEICMVTTTEDYIIVEDSTKVDSNGVMATSAVIAPGSLRDCAYRDGPVWILFEKSGTYNLTGSLRLKSNKTIDGRGRDVRITGMGILTEESKNLIFENLTFSAPSVTVSDTANRRAISIHNTTHHVWIDHCSFEKYPLVELDVKRGSHDVTISWSRFENGSTGILFGLTPDLIDESAQTLTLHHNYFDRLNWSGMYARRGRLHAYNNFFKNQDHYGIECSDSARCYVEKNVFDTQRAVLKYRLWEDDVPVDTTVGLIDMKENWLTQGLDEDVSESDFNSLMDYKPEYEYFAETADANLAWTVKNMAGPR